MVTSFCTHRRRMVASKPSYELLRAKKVTVAGSQNFGWKMFGCTSPNLLHPINLRKRNRHSDCPGIWRWNHRSRGYGGPWRQWLLRGNDNRDNIRSFWSKTGRKIFWYNRRLPWKWRILRVGCFFAAGNPEKRIDILFLFERSQQQMHLLTPWEWEFTTPEEITLWVNVSVSINWFSWVFEENSISPVWHDPVIKENVPMESMVQLMGILDR